MVFLEKIDVYKSTIHWGPFWNCPVFVADSFLADKVLGWVRTYPPAIHQTVWWHSGKIKKSGIPADLLLILVNIQTSPLPKEGNWPTFVLAG